MFDVLAFLTTFTGWWCYHDLKIFYGEQLCACRLLVDIFSCVHPFQNLLELCLTVRQKSDEHGFVIDASGFELSGRGGVVFFLFFLGDWVWTAAAVCTRVPSRLDLEFSAGSLWRKNFQVSFSVSASRKNETKQSPEHPSHAVCRSDRASPSIHPCHATTTRSSLRAVDGGMEEIGGRDRKWALPFPFFEKTKTPCWRSISCPLSLVWFGP
jgi:hypothetical protein